MLDFPRRDWKFRAWVIPEKRMMDWKEFLMGNDRWNMFVGFGNECYPCNQPKYHFHVMQWTGIQDSDGNDIYEGDIIEYFAYCYADGPGCEFTWEREIGYTVKEWCIDEYAPKRDIVYWDTNWQSYAPIIITSYDGWASFDFILREAKEEIPLNSKGKPNYPPPYIRVIGNIFENPELVEKCNEQPFQSLES